MTYQTVILSIFFGFILGSFLNVCIYRIPLKKSIIKPPSSCPACGTAIKFYDNVPVASWLILKGRCRNCSNYISIRYPVVEIIAGIISFALFLRYGLTVSYFLYLIFMLSLIVISFIDFDHMIIPDLISIPGIIIGFAASFLLPDLKWTASLIGIIAGGGILFITAFIFEKITGKEGMGGGDIKLLAMIGAWLGWKLLPVTILMAALTASVCGGLFILLSKKDSQTRIPFGPFLSYAAIFCFFFGNDIMIWYVHKF